MKSIYPSKKEILQEKPTFKDGVIEITKLWKKTAFKGWNKKEKWIKLESLGLLIEALSVLHKKGSPRIILGEMYYYNPKEKIICLDANHPSIISTLHEFGHYLYGKSELKACQWSVWLFIESFPELYAKLEWKDHMLIKKKPPYENDNPARKRN